MCFSSASVGKHGTRHRLHGTGNQLCFLGKSHKTNEQVLTYTHIRRRTPKQTGVHGAEEWGVGLMRSEVTAKIVEWAAAESIGEIFSSQQKVANIKRK